jgi:uncharacterized protein (DUF433 family)
MPDLLDRISIDPNVCFGKPCIKGTRIWVSLILDFLASGNSEAEIIEAYPHLQRDDIRAAIAYELSLAISKAKWLEATERVLSRARRQSACL